VNLIYNHRLIFYIRESLTLKKAVTAVGKHDGHLT